MRMRHRDRPLRMNHESKVRRKLTANEAVLAAKLCYADPELAELMASGGIDALWICLEHRKLDPALVHALVQACRLGGADAFIRVKPSNYSDLLWLLEAGAHGLMLPRVRHPDEARAFVEAAKFPPLGRRGCDAIHADCDFGRRPLAEYVAAANDRTFLAVQIEEPEIVPHIETIAALPGVDVLFVGPGDLSLGYGRPGCPGAPEVVAAIERVAAACRRHGKVAGIPCAPEEVVKYRALGYSFFNVVSVFRCISAGLKQALATARAAS